MKDQLYREEKEAFYVGHRGSSFALVLALLLHAPVYTYLARAVLHGRHERYGKADFMCVAVEIGLVVTPLFLQLTLWSDYVLVSLPALLFLAVTVHWANGGHMQWPRQGETISHVQSCEGSLPDESEVATAPMPSGVVPSGDDTSDGATPWESPLEPRSRKNLAFVSNFRGSLVLLTCMSILFVDFTVFPRYHAKTENQGVSLMDIGIGAFVFSSGLTSRFARGLSMAGHSPRNTLRVVVVAALGLGRLLCLRALDYHEHTSEYGVHWNFFVTLAFVWLNADTLHGLVPPKPIPILAAAMLVLYRCVLAWSDLEEVVLSSPRTNIVEANREGILSVLGFTALYLIAESISLNVLFRHGSGPSHKIPLGALGTIASSAVGLYIVLVSLDRAPVSRRLTNPAYIVVVLAICTTVLFAFALVERALQTMPRSDEARKKYEYAAHSSSLSVVFDAFSRNQLPLFLAANILTGAVNLTFYTIHMPNGQALALLAMYTCALILLATFGLPRSIL